MYYSDNGNEVVYGRINKYDGVFQVGTLWETFFPEEVLIVKPENIPHLQVPTVTSDESNVPVKTKGNFSRYFYRMQFHKLMRLH